MRPSPGRRLIALCMGLQALLGGAWWLGLALAPSIRDPFVPSGWSFGQFAWLAAADVPLFVGGSAVCTYASIAAKPWLRLSLITLAIWIAVATLYCAAVQLLSGSYLVPLTIMAASLVFTTGLALTTSRDEPLLPRFPTTPSPDRKTARNAARTFVQVVVFWTVFLVAMPATIAAWERAIGLPRFVTPAWLGWSLLAAASVGNLLTAASLVRLGKGTPLPTQSTNALVVTGPYRVIRNPMAVAGLTQGLAVALLLGSPGMVAAVLFGGFLWHVTIRPVEEYDLLQRFGDVYAEYKSRTRCWMPVIGPR